MTSKSQGVKFETYAAQRIRGAILDGLRQTDHVSRTLRKKEKMIREAWETLEQSLLRKPTATLDVHKSRVSQLHSQALKRIRAAAEKQGLHF
ncbi:sigma-70 family RNA polymerase sigma factor [Bacillus sp. OK048]|uniref:sigma-70 family RNA polymerase sigma factor n=1 Tax=Bacillus sp. OK048 TaxID=1882761 RepID=UPI000891C0D0|nr:hypothetical protein [Bacillus sp. OK048]SDM38571.1 hypothetical protein SAMN05443253_103135 [Bacillus sp. OK048]